MHNNELYARNICRMKSKWQGWSFTERQLSLALWQVGEDSLSNVNIQISLVDGSTHIAAHAQLLTCHQRRCCNFTSDRDINFAETFRLRFYVEILNHFASAVFLAILISCSFISVSVRRTMLFCKRIVSVSYFIIELCYLLI